MKGPANEIWVTSVLTENDVVGALVLCRSLKRVLTTRKVGVIVSPKLSPRIREILNDTFDHLIFLEENRNIGGLEGNDFVKLFTLTLQGFYKCAYLSPNMMVIRNCDEMFKKYKTFRGMVFGENMDMSVCMSRPSTKLFKDLMLNLVQRKTGEGIPTILEKLTKVENEHGIFIEGKYNRKVDQAQNILSGKEIFIANFKENPEMLLGQIGTLGLVGQKLVQYWIDVYNNEVKPLLQPELTLSHEPLAELKFDKEPIAIVGMSCRYPGSKNLEEFWNLLINGQDGTGPAPDFRWTKDQTWRNHPDYRRTNAGFLSVPVDEFDAKFFGISPKEMLFMDPQHRLLHELVWESLENAAINPETLRGTNGSVFIGSWTNGYQEILSYCGSDDFYRMYMGNSLGSAAAKLSFLLGMTGPNIATESGCSSAMVAVHLACRSLQLEETNMALACGVNLLLHPFDKDLMPMVVSPNGRCKTFDANADGFARAEGCGVLVLKRLSDAVNDGDFIWGLLRGSGVSQEGLSKSMGTPTIHSEALAMTEALEDAQVAPEMVSYVETHGTGTPVGDPMEVAAIAKAYGTPNRISPLIIGSVKTNVGHSESCSGITGIMKVVLAMHHEVIPPHINFETLNPAINLEAVPAKIPVEPIPWKKSTQPRVAGVSSFGITGTDTHVIVQESPQNLSSGKILFPQFERDRHIVTMSAKTEEALTILIDRFKSYASSTSNNIADIAFTTNVGRAQFNHRAAILAQDTTDFASNITQAKYLSGEVSESVGKICFLFTGQGSQYPGMGKMLYDKSPTFRIHFDYCTHILKSRYGISIKDVIWSSNPSSQISRTVYSQTAIFCVEYALLKLWESWGVKPDFVLGHSLGEFCAAVAAGVVTVEDALMLVAERSSLIDNLPSGKMLVVKADKQSVNKAMQKFAGNDTQKIMDYAAVNSNEQTVMAGDSQVISDFAEYLTKAGQKCVMLEATHAFHSRHMDPILNEYRRIAENVKVQNPSHEVLYISGMRGEITSPGEITSKYWVDHTREKVEFLRASKKVVEEGCRVFIEIGPQPVLSALTMMNNDVNLLCFPSLKRNEDDWTTLLGTLAKLYVKGVNIDWNGFDEYYSRKKVHLPHYPFMGKRFWPDMITITGSTIHPLVGSLVPSATSTKIFQNAFNLRSLEYVKDHAIGHHVIFPGAGYLEMCLAAGLATVDGAVDSLTKPSRPIKVENLQIAAPLCLSETKSSSIQTVVDINFLKKTGDWNDLTVKIFHKMDSDSSQSIEWLPHATAIYSPLVAPEDKTVAFDLTAFEQTLATSSDCISINQAYDKLASLGLKFGPVFRSLEEVWRNETQNTFLARVKVPCEESSQGQYMIHPAILDAMIQSIMMLERVSKLKKKLYVPIKIGKFIWYSSPQPEESLFIHAHTSGESTSTLVTRSGKVLAVMSSVEFIDTTVKAIESVLEQQTISMPDLWETSWKPLIGPCQHRYSDLTSDPYMGNRLEKHMKAKYTDNPSQHLLETFNNLEELCYLIVLRGLYECGWKPELNLTFSESNLLQNLQIKSDFRQYVAYFMGVFEQEGILEKGRETNCWKVLCAPPTHEEIMSRLATPRLGEDTIKEFHSTKLLLKLGDKMCDMFQGRVSPLAIMFPERKDDPNIWELYQDLTSFFKIGAMMEEVAIDAGLELNRKLAECPTKKKVVLRVLEVGAGTGSYTKLFFELMAPVQVDIEYTFTDISAAFFAPAQQQFEKYSRQITYKKLNIEEDPISQGFLPCHYDIIIAAQVLHTLKDVRKSLRNLAMLLAPSGEFHIVESTRDSTMLTTTFGLLPGFWNFEDYDLRPNHCSMNKLGWQTAMEAAGCKMNFTFSTFNNMYSNMGATKISDTVHHIRPEKPICWVIFDVPGVPMVTHLKEKISGSTNRHVVTVEMGTTFQQIASNKFCINWSSKSDHETLMEALSKNVKVEGILFCWALDKQVQPLQVFQSYFNVVKAALTLKGTLPHMIVVTSNASGFGEDVSSYGASSLWAFNTALKNEWSEIHSRCVDVPDLQTDVDETVANVFYEMWNIDKGTQVAYKDGTKYMPKMYIIKPVNDKLSLPPLTHHFQLVLPDTKSIADLQFGPMDTVQVKENEVKVQVATFALNFRDLLCVLKPTEEFKNWNIVGFDFVGVVTQVGRKVTKWTIGDAVFGASTHGKALPSHLTMDENVVQRVPDNMTYSEAATLPAVFATVYYCLVDVAKIQSRDTVLIHTASGGVGLAAIQLCQQVGCTIIATAGSKRKQNYLRSLGIQHIFHSRTTKYGEDILKLTNGRGVDVVLNSLTGEGFKEATLGACAQNGRFIEMSKISTWTEKEVKELRADVKYDIVDLTSMAAEEWTRLMRNLADYYLSSKLKPLPYVRYDALSIRDALQFMQKAKHVGKIVVTMPEMSPEGVVTTPMFNDRSTYIITGGLGGIGFEVCKWMVQNGAKNIVLAGRSGIPNETMSKEIQTLNSSGSRIIPVKLDVGNFEDCKYLFEKQIPAMELPQVRGIMHAAGTLADGMITSHTWETFATTLQTKIKGTMNLHELTKNYNLEHFVLFSSMASMFGSPGQSNHAAGNKFEDILAMYRHSIGLPATTVNWGLWGETGIATEVDIPGVKALSTLQGLNSLEYILKTNRLQTGAITIGSYALWSKLIPELGTFVDDKVWKAQTASGAFAIKSEEFWERYDTLNSRDEKLQLMTDVLRVIIRHILKLDEGDDFDVNANLQESGVDSLMFVEIKNSVQNLLGTRVTVSASSLRDCVSINLLAQTLTNIIEGDDTTDGKLPTTQEVTDLLREDCHLPDHIRATNGQHVGALKDIKTVLLTGGTGTLGPYLLRDLVNFPQISKVYCLMRQPKTGTCAERLEKSLKGKSNLDVNMEKVECISGNVAAPCLGMEESIWEQLSHEVDAVFHCAALVQHVEYYQKRNSSSDMRAVNIGGIRHVLEFSCEKRLKRVYYASSILAVAHVDEQGILSENWPNLEDYDGVTTVSYPITKFVGDCLMKQAAERGIPVKAFRFPFITGESKSGEFTLEGNHLMLRYMFILKKGLMPSNPAPIITLPVDICSDISMKVFFHEKSCESDIYNVMHPRPFIDQEFPQVAKKFGYRVDIVEFSEFTQQIRESSAEESGFTVFKELYRNDEDSLKYYTSIPALVHWVEDSKSFWTCSKVNKLLPNVLDSLPPSLDWLENDLVYAKQNGWF